MILDERALIILWIQIKISITSALLDKNTIEYYQPHFLLMTAFLSTSFSFILNHKYKIT